MELSEKFKENMKILLKNDYQKYIDSLSFPAKKGIRRNILLADEKTLDHFLLISKQKLLGLENCYSVEDDKLGSTLCHHLGLIYCQEPSAMLPAIALEVCEGDRVLDLCSAPGGKASQILEKNTTGVVVLNEVNRARVNILQSNIERQGFKNALITSASSEKLAKLLPAYFDKILVDAPCSGEGMFRKDPDTIAEWNEGINQFNHARQIEILKNADKMLKRGGIIVYSTCTFSKLENEETVKEFCEECGYEVVPLLDAVKQNVREGQGEYSFGKYCGRCYPFDNFGEGQFLAKLVKKSDENNAVCKKPNINALKLSQNELKNAKTLLKQCINNENLPLYKVGNCVFTYPFEPATIQDVVCLGVCVGNIEKDRITPHHQFFRAFGKDFVNQINLEYGDKNIEKYLIGEEIDCDKNGYVCVLCEGIPLGGGKASLGKLKNYYPKGLRGKIRF